VDDGVSGVTFDRPGFQAMLAEIEAGNVAVAITKDCCAIMGLNQKDLETQGILA
jgi:DNA invertase Pin-like site-specific DNA recombinase